MTGGEATRSLAGHSDFGRELSRASEASPEPVSDRDFARAVRDRAERTIAAEARRYRIVMLAAGFLGGSLVVVPSVIWLAGLQRQPEATASRITSVRATLGGPALVSAPLLLAREPAASTALSPPRAELNRDAKTEASAQADLPAEIERARALLHAGSVEAARRSLADPNLAGSGEALFVLAETYDPNVLAALGATAARADADAARRLYRAARELGVAGTASRLEALQ